MKKILLAFLLLGLLGGWVEKPNEKEKTEVSLANLEKAKIYFSNGNTKFELGNFEGAISDYTKAIELNPELKNPYKD